LPKPLACRLETVGEEALGGVSERSKRVDGGIEVDRRFVQEKEGEREMTILKDLGVPIFKAGGMPTVDLSAYVLSVEGLVKETRQWSWER